MQKRILIKNVFLNNGVLNLRNKICCRDAPVLVIHNCGFFLIKSKEVLFKIMDLDIVKIHGQWTLYHFK